ncbi:MAG TPA: NCS2 family permease [Synergistales bacterium]|nr:NCS2 family permease [Synergistaceae bacterium]NLD96825.1 NCS2 family permease [Synergistaceae bacterium]HPE65142.1 NCS2 family permease [Synergistales bacterium]
MASLLENRFHLKEAGTDVKTEVLAGITTFMTMAYIIFVNPGILQNAGMPFGALMTATCLASALATFLMAFMANYPIALAPGMGLNAFFAFSVVLGMGISWQVALAAIFVEGILFILLTLTKIRESVVNGIPKSLKIGISTGIGLFIAFIGLQSAGVIVKNDAVLVGLGNLKSVEVLLACLGFFIMGALEARKVKGSILWGILIITGIAVFLGVAKAPEALVSTPPSVMPIFMKMDFSGLMNPNFWIVMFSFFFVDFFDTVGTLVGVTNRAGMLDAEGRLPRAREALMADAIGTTAGAVLGTSTVTSYVESASGVEQGGRTGLTALVTGVLFLLALFFSPIVSIVPACATAPALVLVGVFMMASLKDLDFSDWTDFVPASVAIFVMPFSYSIAHGIEFGIISFVVLKVLGGKAKDVSPIMLVLAALFVAKEIFF